MDPLIHLHRRLQKVVDIFGVRPLAQKVFRYCYAKSYAGAGLASAVQNGREWLLVPEVALRGESAEFETVEWLRRVVKAGDTVIDVGANVGQMTLEMALLVGPYGKVIAVEPGPGNLQILRRHVDANGFSDRVTVVAAACCETHGGSIEFKFFGTSPNVVGSGHSLVLERAPMSEHETEVVVSKVSSVSLDGLCAGLGIRPSVIKIDVEGAELRVLEGARQTLRSARPALRIGFHPFAFRDLAATGRALISLLQDCGYETGSISGPEQLELKEYDFYPQAGKSA
jgi:FkbM family methyltransferase